MTVRWRHDRGEMGPSNSPAGLFVSLVEGGISILSGRRVLVVEAFEAAILTVKSTRSKRATVQQLKMCSKKRVVPRTVNGQCKLDKTVSECKRKSPQKKFCRDWGRKKRESRTESDTMTAGDRNEG